MRYQIIAKTSSHKPCVIELTPNIFEVAVSAPPIKGSANAAILDALANHLHVKPNRLFLVSGHTQKNKVVELI